MENQKTFLVIALAVVFFLLFQAWQAQNAPKPVTPATSTVSKAVTPSAAPVTAPTVSPSTMTVPAAVSQAMAPARGPSVPFSTKVFTGHIGLHGGDIQNLGLRAYPVATDNPAPYPILDTSSAKLTTQQSGFLGSDGQLLIPQFAEEKPSSDTDSPIVLKGKAGPLTITKTWVFQPDSYLAEEHIQVTNSGTQPWNGSYFDQILRNDRAESHMFMSIFTGAVLMHGGNFSEVSFGEMRDHPRTEAGPGWAGMMDHYFLAAVLPAEQAQHVQVYARPSGSNYVAGVNTPLPTLAPGQSTTITQQIFLGPKQQSRLAALGRGLEQTVDYGWFAIIAEPMHLVLKWFHGLVGNWGLAIILLVIVIKAIFFYPSAISYRSMANMRKLQPKLEKLKKECGDDKQKLGAAMMELYRTEKVNPMAGCLPILLQMPFFIALYWVLVESVSLRQAPFILWIHDLAVPDPYYILPLLMGISMFFQQRLNPAPVDPMQKKIMSALPVIFAVFFSFFPAGLVLYWLTNNVVSIGQQYLITRHIMAAKD
ncbi:membrane protein insertase YidC [Acidithiobacillus thiooxidans]|uniref:Membrane protein insertase YidC n=1 Tax=Acidithiobacillus thiooxidans ATCC 19377 TaxID=637390 RepID=A0A543Q727_ACITH|nr:membrane protein insertase YidC [Acidithiobacillus thiooxidans]MDR7928610.1 membrane protein insertase YidC [Acidithiobacillus thiooxidans]MDX5933676.1 membrane protein insertase YidC [Acidithiobacillus thiooxidans]TQN52109.1 Membrane protein insertase YidC [Acidithiobacillus thiooxidans ATCC 19377]